MAVASVETTPDDPSDMVGEFAVAVFIGVVVTAAGDPRATELEVRQYAGIVVIVTVTKLK